MASETSQHTYREFTDNPAEGKDAAFGSCASLFLFIVSFPLSLILFLILLIFCNWQISLWISLSVFALVIIMGLRSKYGYDKSSPRLKEAERAKDFLGFDFGTDFTLRSTASHEYEEILLDFSEESFLPLMSYCQKFDKKEERIDSDNKIIITKNLPYIKVIDESIINWGDVLIKKAQDGKLYRISIDEIKKEGFTKIESYYDPKLSKDKNLWITKQVELEVDFQYRTLKMSYTYW